MIFNFNLGYDNEHQPDCGFGGNLMTFMTPADASLMFCISSRATRKKAKSFAMRRAISADQLDWTEDEMREFVFARRFIFLDDNFCDLLTRIVQIETPGTKLNVLTN